MRDESHKSAASFSSASNWTEIKQIRKDLGFSQANIAELLEIDQTQISRYEGQGKEVSPAERSALLSIETELADKPLNGAIKRLQKMQVFITGTQQAAGGFLGTFFDVAMPIEMKRAVVRAMMKDQDVF